MKKVIYHKDLDKAEMLYSKRLMLIKACILDAVLEILNPTVTKQDRIDIVTKKSKELLTQLNIPENMEEVEV